MNDPIEVIKKKYFELKPGLNFLNPANDFRQHLQSDGLTIASGPLTADNIDKMFDMTMNEFYKSAQDEDVIVNRLFTEYMALQIQDMPKYVKHINKSVEKFTKADYDNPLGLSIACDFSEYLGESFLKADSTLEHVAHFVSAAAKAAHNALSGKVGDTGEDGYKHLMDVALGVSRVHQKAHPIIHLVQHVRDMATGEGWAKKGKKTKKSKSESKTKHTSAPKRTADHPDNVDKKPLENVPEDLKGTVEETTKKASFTKMGEFEQIFIKSFMNGGNMDRHMFKHTSEEQ